MSTYGEVTAAELTKNVTFLRSDENMVCSMTQGQKKKQMRACECMKTRTELKTSRKQDTV